MIAERTARWVEIPARIMVRLDESETPSRMRFVFFDGDERVCKVTQGAAIGAGIARMLQKKVEETGEICLW